MLYHKEGLPEENELVMCTITNVQYNSVFCKLDEYQKSGMIHISEVSPGRIRNIRDYVSEGKKVVCKILRVDEEKGHIDLSLRRVTENQKRAKAAEMKQELKAEKLLEFYAKQVNQDIKKLYKEVAQPILQNYEYLHVAFDDLVTEQITLEELKVPKEHAQKLSDLIKEKISPPSVTIKGALAVTTYHTDGVEAVKEALVKAQSVNKDQVTIKYLGNGKYQLQVTSPDYEHAEPLLEQAIQAAQEVIDTKGPGTVSFKRA